MNVKTERARRVTVKNHDEALIHGKMRRFLKSSDCLYPVWKSIPEQWAGYLHNLNIEYYQSYRTY